MQFASKVENGTAKFICTFEPPDGDELELTATEFAIYATYSGDNRYSVAASDVGYMARSALTDRNTSTKDCHLNVSYTYDSTSNLLNVTCNVIDFDEQLCADATGVIVITILAYA